MVGLARQEVAKPIGDPGSAGRNVKFLASPNCKIQPGRVKTMRLFKRCPEFSSPTRHVACALSRVPPASKRNIFAIATFELRGRQRACPVSGIR